jgi:hypothetical protein
MKASGNSESDRRHYIAVMTTEDDWSIDQHGFTGKRTAYCLAEDTS